MAVFETRDMFLIYRDADKYLPLPKVVVGDDAHGLRELFARELGRSGHVRVKASAGRASGRDEGRGP